MKYIGYDFLGINYFGIQRFWSNWCFKCCNIRARLILGELGEYCNFSEL